MNVKYRGGRPLKFKSAKKLQERIDEYFESCYEEIWTEQPIKEKNKIVGYKWVPDYDRHGNIQKRLIRPPTITGLAVHLGTSRQTLLDYEERAEFVDTIKKAKDRIEAFAEEQLFTNRNTAGVIFNMVNNYGWKNRQENDTNLKLDPSDLTPEQADALIKEFLVGGGLGNSL